MKKLPFKSSFILYTLGLVSLFYVTLELAEGEELLFLIYLMFLVIGNVLYTRKTEKKLYFVSLSYSLIMMPFLLSSYIEETGEMFIPGGDAERYYTIIIDAANGNYKNFYGRYLLYLYLGECFYRFIGFLGGGESPVLFFLLNVGIGANLAPVLYKMCGKIFKKDLVYSAALLTVVFPGFVIISTNSWRESFAYLPFLVSMFYAMNIKNNKNLIIYFIAFLFLANIRLEMAMVSICFFICYNYLFFEKGKNKHVGLVNSKLFILSILSIGLVYAYTLGLFEYFNWTHSSSISTQVQTYDNISSAKSSQGGSITNMLRNSGVIGRVFLFVYTLFVPLPPPVFSEPVPSFFNILQSIGAFAWYFILPFSLLGVKKGLKKENLRFFTKSIIVMIFIGVSIIAMTSVGSPRHKYYFYPILFLYYFLYRQETKKQQRVKTLMLILILYVILVLGYLGLKYF